jgi:hypothetical protein
MLGFFGRGFHGVAFVCAASLTMAVISPTEALAARLGGPYYVDDAEIGKVGSCETESWASFAPAGGQILVFSPACVVNLGAPVEIGTNLVRLNPGGDQNASVSGTAKTVPIPIPREGHGFGLALSGAVIYDLSNGGINGGIFNVPLTFDFSKQLRLNINVGAQYFSDGGSTFGTAGAGVAWSFVKEWSWISEMFAIMGPGQTNPRFQSGLRYSPTKDIDWDLIYGRNLLGEGKNWITGAFTFRLGPR